MLNRYQPLRRRKRLRPMSDRRRDAIPERHAVRWAVFERDGHCLLDRRTSYGGSCYGPPTFHHLRKEGQGGAYTAENGVTLCAHHNGWVENYPEVAYAIGLVLKAGDPPELAWSRLRTAGLVP
jgi:hypothetical protein